MSYDIIFDTQFVKTTDGKIIPMVLIGCNNLTNRSRKSGKEIVAREWVPLVIENSPVWEPQALIQHFFEKIPSPSNQWFKKGGKWLDDKGLLSWLKNSIKNARTLEEIGTKLQFERKCWLETKDPYRSVKVEQAVAICTNSEELAQALPLMSLGRDEIRAKGLAQWEREYPGIEPKKIDIYVYTEFPNWEYWLPNRRPQIEKRVVKPALGGDFFCVKMDGNYLVKKTSRRIFHASFLSQAKKFATANSAEEWVKKSNILEIFSSHVFYVSTIKDSKEISERRLEKLTLCVPLKERPALEQQMETICEGAKNDYAKIKWYCDATKQSFAFIEIEKLAKEAIGSIMEQEDAAWYFVGENAKKESVYQNPRLRCIYNKEFGWLFEDKAGGDKRTSLSRFQTENEEWKNEWYKNLRADDTGTDTGKENLRLGRNAKGEIIEECHNSSKRGRWTGEPLEYRIEEAGSLREGSDFETTIETWRRASPKKIIISAQIQAALIAQYLQTATALFEELKLEKLQGKKRPIEGGMKI